VKSSGLGQVNGPTGLRGYCHAMPISADRKGRGKVQGAYPYTEKANQGMQKFIRFLWGGSLGRWLS
jgi:succinate-semialdehyde dehydrogenase/glutarate-semialdehyde dehydrogenase